MFILCGKQWFKSKSSKFDSKGFQNNNKKMLGYAVHISLGVCLHQGHKHFSGFDIMCYFLMYYDIQII